MKNDETGYVSLSSWYLDVDALCSTYS